MNHTTVLKLILCFLLLSCSLNSSQDSFCDCINYLDAVFMNKPPDSEMHGLIEIIEGPIGSEDTSYTYQISALVNVIVKLDSLSGYHTKFKVDFGTYSRISNYSDSLYQKERQAWIDGYSHKNQDIKCQ